MYREREREVYVDPSVLPLADGVQPEFAASGTSACGQSITTTITNITIVTIIITICTTNITIYYYYYYDYYYHYYHSYYHY